MNSVKMKQEQPFLGVMRSSAFLRFPAMEYAVDKTRLEPGFQKIFVKKKFLPSSDIIALSKTLQKIVEKNFLIAVQSEKFHVRNWIHAVQQSGHSSGCGFRWNEVKTAFWTYISAKLDFQNSLEVEYDFWLSLEMECAVFYFQFEENDGNQTDDSNKSSQVSANENDSTLLHTNTTSDSRILTKILEVVMQNQKDLKFLSTKVTELENDNKTFQKELSEIKDAIGSSDKAVSSNKKGHGWIDNGMQKD
ncbi:hypothetical protein GLOIN_2v1842516 [Rhizophagus irregularis DAOM 181602=DAOM 197198]|uniref:Uncharacterized protein n=1 Tax=Rhizophagus irregularis (strain DAOM 181602 / DAOM 197198 / MUCL 43194) TaxID=747089 RepID=A0A2P4PUY2_RHIID|nr:hypothetical protein GLOIN_2v1842516 [Rhizophagus irregularis DAOM 181602=DAOM 197198]POG69192.1 hypothetical protein GLOIN_2v1842516 [Rhizophagus irregularis DAOM 181602=DAOM 197198]|eukprot:XP_025176058.1 hypothetical protein GLOIN_2v1842516 [Rhizophagus irregularis DAOM 181602=DAOM 197198]